MEEIKCKSGRKKGYKIIFGIFAGVFLILLIVSGVGYFNFNEEFKSDAVEQKFQEFIEENDLNEVKTPDPSIKNPLTNVNPRRSFLNSSGDEVLSLDHEGSIIGIGNLTFTDSGEGYGFFKYLGSKATRITKGWFTDVDVSGTVNTTYLNATNVFGNLNWSYLQNIPSYVKDWSLALTHLSNFTDDILWTSGFNATGDGRWSDSMDYTNIGLINQSNTWEEQQNFSKGIITTNITATDNLQTFLELFSKEIIATINNDVIFNISSNAHPSFIFPSATTRFSIGDTTPDNIFEITSNEADFFLLQSTTKPILKVDGSTQKVGIRTASPSVELDINGSARVEENLTLDGYPKGSGLNRTMQQVDFSSESNFYTSDASNVYVITLNSTTGVKYVKYEFCGYLYDVNGDSTWAIDVVDCDGNKLATTYCATQSLNTESPTYDSCCVSGVDTSLKDNCNYSVNLDEKLGSAYLFHESTELIKYMDGAT